MKYYVLSDNVDTLAGFGLAGIEGEIAHTADETRAAINRISENGSIAILLITEKLIPLCPELIYEIKLTKRAPLIVEIPDRHGSVRESGSISQYVRDAIGVKI